MLLLFLILICIKQKWRKKNSAQVCDNQIAKEYHYNSSFLFSCYTQINELQTKKIVSLRSSVCFCLPFHRDVNLCDLNVYFIFFLLIFLIFLVVKFFVLFLFWFLFSRCMYACMSVWVYECQCMYMSLEVNNSNVAKSINYFESKKKNSELKTVQSGSMTNLKEFQVNRIILSLKCECRWRKSKRNKRTLLIDDDGAYLVSAFFRGGFYAWIWKVNNWVRVRMRMSVLFNLLNIKK